jgi:hypothetical protein
VTLSRDLDISLQVESEAATSIGALAATVNGNHSMPPACPSLTVTEFKVLTRTRRPDGPVPGAGPLTEWRYVTMTSQVANNLT